MARIWKVCRLGMVSVSHFLYRSGTGVLRGAFCSIRGNLLFSTINEDDECCHKASENEQMQSS